MGRAESCELVGQGKSLDFIIMTEGDVVWSTVNNHSGCSTENGLRRPKAGAAREIERLLQARGGGGLTQQSPTFLAPGTGTPIRI